MVLCLLDLEPGVQGVLLDVKLVVAVLDCTLASVCL